MATNKKKKTPSPWRPNIPGGVTTSNQSMANEITLPRVVYLPAVNRVHAMLSEALNGKAAFSRGGHVDMVPFLMDSLVCRRQKWPHGNNNCNGTADCTGRQGHLQAPPPPLAFSETSRAASSHQHGLDFFGGAASLNFLKRGAGFILGPSPLSFSLWRKPSAANDWRAWFRDAS